MSNLLQVIANKSASKFYIRSHHYEPAGKGTVATCSSYRVCHVVGLIAFSLVVIVMVNGEVLEPNQDAEQLQTKLAALLVGIAIVEIVAYFVMRNVMLKKLREAWCDTSVVGRAGSTVGHAGAMATDRRSESKIQVMIVYACVCYDV